MFNIEYSMIIPYIYCIMSSITLRTANENDIPAIGLLFSETVRNVNSKDYTEDEIRAWSSSGENTAMWKKRIGEQYFIVAEINGVIAGFSSIDPSGYLDFMYVHKDHQRSGVASALLNEIETKAKEQKNTRIFSHVSRTARGFFERSGYRYSGEVVSPGFIYSEGRNVPYPEVEFVNSIMVKEIRNQNVAANFTNYH